MELTKSQIEEINRKSPSDQGVFVEPYSIPSHIKEPVVYMRWEKSGMGGGSCWGGNATYYENSDKPSFKVLDLVLMELKPNLTYLQFKLVEELIQKTEDTDYEYYGNCTDWDISYIILSELIDLLESF